MYKLIRGTSGALVGVNGKYVLKYGRGKVGKRVGAQGDWLKKQESQHFPKIFRTGKNHYVMERLEECPYAAWDPIETLEILGKTVWTRSAGRPNWIWHETYLADVCERAEAHHLHDMMYDKMKTLSGHAVVQECDIHGDPTAGNSMLRFNLEDENDLGTAVLTDPLPLSDARGTIPPLAAVDVGKVLQSLTGYEDIKAGREPEVRWNAIKRVELWLGDEEEWFAAKYFLLLHWLRLLPYQPQAERVACQKNLEQLTRDLSD